MTQRNVCLGVNGIQYAAYLNPDLVDVLICQPAGTFPFADILRRPHSRSFTAITVSRFLVVWLYGARGLVSVQFWLVSGKSPVLVEFILYFFSS